MFFLNDFSFVNLYDDASFKYHNSHARSDLDKIFTEYAVDIISKFVNYTNIPTVICFHSAISTRF